MFQVQGFNSFRTLSIELLNTELWNPYSLRRAHPSIDVTSEQYGLDVRS
jgi:hypothetical protein